MSKAIFDNFHGPNNTPANFPYGFTVSTSAAGTVNNIGTAGQAGFGCGICPGPLPAGMTELFGTKDPLSDSYGNSSTVMARLWSGCLRSTTSGALAAMVWQSTR
jgi:hypothetical protein